MALISLPARASRALPLRQLAMSWQALRLRASLTIVPPVPRGPVKEGVYSHQLRSPGVRRRRKSIKSASHPMESGFRRNVCTFGWILMVLLLSLALLRLEMQHKKSNTHPPIIETVFTL